MALLRGTLGVEFTITREPSPEPSAGMPICFRAATDRVVVDAFYEAIAAGAGTRGRLAPRAVYYADY